MISWSAHRPAVVWATAFCILTTGAVAFTRLPLATKPVVELPKLQAQAQWPGASPELVETYITSPLEAAVQGVRGVKKVSSESGEGSSDLTIDLEPDANVQLTRLAILERLELLRKDLPGGQHAAPGEQLRPGRPDRATAAALYRLRPLYPGDARQAGEGPDLAPGQRGRGRGRGELGQLGPDRRRGDLRRPAAPPARDIARAHYPGHRRRAGGAVARQGALRRHRTAGGHAGPAARGAGPGGTAGGGSRRPDLPAGRPRHRCGWRKTPATPSTG